MAQRDKFPDTAFRVSTPEETILGRHLWARGYLAVSPGNITDELIQQYIQEQEGDPITDDSRFEIDPS